MLYHRCVILHLSLYLYRLHCNTTRCCPAAPTVLVNIQTGLVILDTCQVHLLDIQTEADSVRIYHITVAQKEK